MMDAHEASVCVVRGTAQGVRGVCAIAAIDPTEHRVRHGDEHERYDAKSHALSMHCLSSLGDGRASPSNLFSLELCAELLPKCG